MKSQFQGNPKDWGQGGSPPPPTRTEATTPPSNPRRVPYGNIPRRHPVKPTLRPGQLRHIQRIAKMASDGIINTGDNSDLMIPALELLAGLHPIGRTALFARDVWGYYGPQAQEQPGHWDFAAAGFVLVGTCANVQPDLICHGEGVFARSATVSAPNCGSSIGVASSVSFSEGQAIVGRYRSLFVGPLAGIPYQCGEYIRNRDFWNRPNIADRDRPVPWVPPVPGTRTVQPVPATVTPPRPTIVEPMPQPSENTWPDPIIPGFVKPKPSNPYRPSEIPANTIEVSPGGIHRPPQEPHVQAPANGKEIKIKVQAGSPAFKAIADIYNNATEADDMLEIIADSIEGNPCKGLRLARRSACIANNWDKIDIDKMMEGLIANWFEDKIIGTFLSWGKKSPYGVHTPTTGPSRRVQPRRIVHNSHYIRPTPR